MSWTVGRGLVVQVEDVQLGTARLIDVVGADGLEVVVAPVCRGGEVVGDEALAAGMPMPAIVTDTMMRSLDDKLALARQCLAFCEQLASGAGRERTMVGR